MSVNHTLAVWLHGRFSFQDDDWRHREWLCQLCGFLLYENIYISIGFLCCISLDRYLAVVHPLRYTWWSDLGLTDRSVHKDTCIPLNEDNLFKGLIQQLLKYRSYIIVFIKKKSWFSEGPVFHFPTTQFQSFYLDIFRGMFLTLTSEPFRH